MSQGCEIKMTTTLHEEEEEATEINYRALYVAKSNTIGRMATEIHRLNELIQFAARLTFQPMKPEECESHLLLQIRMAASTKAERDGYEAVKGQHPEVFKNE